MYVGGKKTEGKRIVCDVRTEECNVGVKQSAQDWGTTREGQCER